MITLLLLKTEKLTDDALFEKYYSKMSDYRKWKTDRMKFRKDRNLSLGAGILIDEYLCSVGLCEKDMAYGEMPNGKPYFVNRPDICFNVSHSDNAVICAFSQEEVGCDIEKVADRNIEIAKRFFTESENEYIFSAKEISEQSQRFFRLWTLKESLLKCTGKGLGGGLSSFEFCFDYKIYVKQNGSRADFRFKEFVIPDYRIAVCSRLDDFSDELKIIEI